MKRVALLIMTAVCVATSASPTVAADLCIKQIGIFTIAVGKSFTTPQKNKCKPFNGFTDSGMVVGTACVTANGSVLRLHFTAHSDFDQFFSFACSFDLPAKTSGHCRFKEITGDQLIFDDFFSATATTCSAAEASVP